MGANGPKQEDLDWISLREELATVDAPESMWDKGIQKCKQSPMVPLGAAATVAALSYGIYNFYHGRTQMSQYMMRTRVVAQAVTVIAILISLNASSGARK